MGDFFAMGGYAPYVWVAFGVTGLVVIGNAVAAFRRERMIRERLRQRILRRAGARMERHSQQDLPTAGTRGKHYDAA